MCHHCEKTSRRNNRTKTTYSLRMEIYWMSTPSVAIIESPQLFSHLLFDSFVFRIAFDVYTQRYIMHTHTRRCAQYKHTSMCLCVWVCARVYTSCTWRHFWLFLSCSRAPIPLCLFAAISLVQSFTFSLALAHSSLFVRSFHSFSFYFTIIQTRELYVIAPFCMWLCVFAL